jgi:hypothetical protein
VSTDRMNLSCTKLCDTTIGLAKNMTVYGIAAIAHNVRKGAKFLTLYGLPDPNYVG